MIRNTRNILFSLAILAILWATIQTIWDRLPKPVNVKDINALPREGICNHKLYDITGKGYTDFRSFVAYSGPAPLYDVAYQSLGLTPDLKTMCVNYPDEIDPIIAQSGQPVYPVLIIVNFETDSIKAGGSYPLKVKAELSNSFPSSLKWNAYMTHDKVDDVTFTVSASNFEYSPSNEDARKLTFGFSLPAEYTWSIAPTERASGEQFLVVYIDSEEASIHASAEITIEVRDTLGLKPSTLAYITTISLVVGYFLSQTKTFIEIIDYLGKLKMKKKK